MQSQHHTAISLCLRDRRIEARPACAGTMAHLSVHTSPVFDRPALISPTQVTVPLPRLSPCFRGIKPCMMLSNREAMLMLIFRLHRRHSDPSQSAIAPLPAVQFARRRRMDQVRNASNHGQSCSSRAVLDWRCEIYCLQNMLKCQKLLDLRAELRLHCCRRRCGQAAGAAADGRPAGRFAAGGACTGSK